VNAGRPPALARWLLRRVCADPYLEAVGGDIDELYRARRQASGGVRATLRYFADVLSIAGTPYGRMHRSTAGDEATAAGLPQRNAGVTGPSHPTHTQSPKSSRTEAFVDKLLQDLKFAARALTAAPAFTAVVVLTLGLGIGATATIFSVVNGVLLQPLPYYEPDRIVQIAEIDPTMENERQRSLASQRLYLAWRENGTALSDVATYSNQSATLTGLDEPIRLTGVAVSPSLFRLLGVDAIDGRTFTDDEEAPGNENVILLSSMAWQRYFGATPNLVGRQVQLDDRSRTVIGIMAPGFEFPGPGIEYWVPMVIQPLGQASNDALAQQSAQTVREEREVRREGPEGGGGRGPGGPDDGPEPEAHIEMWSQVIGRLADGVGITRATEEGTSLVRGTRDDEIDPEEQARVELTVLQDQLVAPVRSSLGVLMGAVGFVLLIACANVANLVLARSAGRSKETAVRAALGAGRFQLVRLLLVEGVVLAGLGGILGLALTAAALQTLRAIGPEFIPRLQNATIDTWALGFTVLVSLATGLLFSLMPARGAAALDLTRALKQDATNDGAAGTLGRDAFRKLLVTAEVALSVVLLVGAGLLVSSFVRLAAVDPGYDPENILTVSLQLPVARHESAQSTLNFLEESIQALEQIPGVEAVTIANVPPTREANIRIGMNVSNEPDTPDRPPVTFGIRVVEPTYFDTLRMRLVDGRFFTRSDRAGAAPVAVVNESAAREIFPDEEPVGQLFPFMGGAELEIIGVVADVRTAGVDPKSSPEVFLPLQQAPARMIPMLFRSPGFMIRTGPAPLSVLPAVRSRMVEIDPEAPVFNVATMSDQISDSVAEPRFYAALVTAFAALAVTLAAIGIYGLLSYTVQQRVRETAIRRALGARGGEVLRGVVRQGMVLTVIGLLLGIGASLALTRVVESMLYDVEPTDPVTIGAAALVFLAVALLAIWIPARRATKIDPMEALRYEG